MVIIKVTTTNNDSNANNNIVSLQEAIAEANSLPGLDTIDLSEIEGQEINARNIIISGDNDIKFLGGGITIDGENQGNIFTIDGANVTFSNLSLINGLAKGGNGSTGAGGGLGAGGALFINKGQVVVDGVTFTGNEAKGGSSSRGTNGGVDDANGSAGGSGGKLNSNSPLYGNGAGGSRGTSSDNDGENGGNGRSGEFGVGGGAGGGGGGARGARIGNGDDGGDGGNGGRGGFGAGGGAGGGGGEDIDNLSANEHGSGGDGADGGTFGGSGGDGSSGSSRNTGTGGGGAGLGGAIFVRDGAGLTIIDSTFTTNSASGGTGNQNGQGKAGAIFALEGSEVTGANLTFTGNSAANSNNNFSGFSESRQDNNDVYGVFNELVFPTVSVSAGTTPRELEEVTGNFNIELSSAFPIDLELDYTIGGDATVEDDYSIPGLTLNENTYEGTVIIPAGRTNVSLEVFPTDDLFFDPNETVTINLLDGTNYELGVTQATLTIDDDEPEVSFIADTATITEGNTKDVEVSLNKPAPVGGLVVNYTVGGSATAEDDYLPLVPANVFVAEGATTASIEITALLDGNNEGNESIELTLTEITNSEGKILDYGVNSNEDSTTVTITNQTVTPPTATNQIVIRETQDSTDVVEGGLSDRYLVALGSQPSGNVTVNIETDSQIENISSLTFTSTNWNQYQSVTVVAVEDDEVEGDHTSTITHTASGYDTATLTVNITEIVDSQETAEGLEEALNQLQAIIEDQLLSLEIPLVGSLGDIAPDFIGTFKDTIINQIATARNLTVDDLTNLLQTEIQNAFVSAGIETVGVSVTPNVSTEEVTFDLQIGNDYALPGISLAGDLGIPALGLSVDGSAEMSFNYGLDLSFGIHDRFGFFLNTDTEKTGLTTGVTLGLSEDFNAEGTLGLLQVDVSNDRDNLTQARIEFGFGLNDLDNVRDIRFFDADEDGKLDDDEVFVERNADGSFDDVVVNGETKSESELTELDLDPDGDRLTNRELSKDDYEFSDLFAPKLTGNLSLGLSSETKLEGVDALPSFLFDIAMNWDEFGYDENGEFQEVGNPNVSFNNMEVDLDSFISDFAKPVLQDIGDLIDPIRPIIDVLNTDTKLFTKIGIKNLFGKKLDANNNGEVSLLELVAALPNSRVSTGFVDAVTKVTDLIDTINEIGDSSEPITIDFGSFDLGTFTEDTDAANVTPEAKGTVEDSEAQVNRLPEGNRKKVVKGFTDDPTIDIPLLSDPLTAIALLLDQPDVTLFNYNFPELGVFLELSQNFPIFGPLSGLLQGSIDISANLGFGFDALGLNQWQALNYDPLESYRVFNGFFINDLNSDGVDVPEIEFDATLTAGAGIDLLALSGYLTGGIKGEIDVDLVDVGENNGSADGKIRGTEFSDRLDTPWEIFDIAGRVSAFLGAEVQVFRQTVYSNHFASIPLLEFNLGASGASLGVGADGYIAGGTVFFDANFNKTLDADEPFTFTNADGTYDLDIPLYLYDVDDSDRLEPEEGQIVIIDGVDISTNLPQTTPLIVIPDTELEANASNEDTIVDTVVSPLTTLMAELSNPDFAPIQDNIASALNLPTGINYLGYDPLAVILNDDNSDAAVRVLAQTGKLQNYLFQTTQIISEATEDIDAEEIALNLLELISERVTTGNTLELSDEESVKNLIDAGIEKIDSQLQISGAVKFVTTQTIIENNQNIDEVVADAEAQATAKAEEIGTYILAPDISPEITQTVINPVDTIVRLLAEPEKTLAASQDIVRNSLNLPNIDLLSYNPLEAIKQGDARGLAIFAEQVKVQNTIVQVTDFITSQTNNTNTEAADIFIQQFASNLESLGNSVQVRSPENPNAPTLLSNAAVINNLIGNTVNTVPEIEANSNLSTSAEITIQETQEDLANVIGQNNQAIDDFASNDEFSLIDKAIEIAKIQKITQGSQNLTPNAQSTTLNFDVFNEETDEIIVNDPTERPDISNSVPVAQSDRVITSDIENPSEIDPINIDVLANDSDADDDNLTITEVYAVNDNNEIIEKDEVTINDNGTLTYTPDSDFDGKDSFFYVITDGNGDFANAEVVLGDPFQISIADVEVAEEYENTTVEFTISLNEESGDRVSVDYVTEDETAVAGEDYVETRGTLTFEPGETEKTVSVEIIGDRIEEESEAFSLRLINPSDNAELSDGRGQATITDDDSNIKLFRFRNVTFNSGTYVFVGAAERDFILNDENLKNTFSLDGVTEDGTINPAFTASTKDGDDLIPFFRLESLTVAGTFLFVSTAEYDFIFDDPVQSQQWKKQGFDPSNEEIDIPEFYLLDNSVGTGTQFNRFQNTQNNTFLYAGEAETEAIEGNPDLANLFTNQGNAFKSL